MQFYVYFFGSQVITLAFHTKGKIMKNALIACAAIIGICATSSIAHAQDDVEDEIVTTPKKKKDYWVYADASLATSQFSTSDGRNTAVSDSSFNAYFRAGVKYKYFGAEVELGQGLSDIEEDGASLGVGSQFSGFAIARIPNEKYDVFLRAGYHSTKFDIGLNGIDPNTGQPFSVSDDIKSDGFAFGVGGTYFFSENFGLRADITGYNTRDIVDAGYVSASLGGAIKF